MSTVSLLEPVPPYQQFATHTAPSPAEAQHSMLYDPRWAEIFPTYLKEVDSFVDAKRKLGTKGSTKTETEEEKAVRVRAAAAKAKSKAEKAERARAQRAGGSEGGGGDEEKDGHLQAGKVPYQPISQPMPIHVPRSHASVVTGAGIFHRLMRSIFSCGCRLGTFAKSFAAQRFLEPSGSTAEADLFPMPLPYPEVFKKSRPKDESEVALKKFIVAVVIVLNYLHLNRPRSIAATLKPQQKLNKRQWEGVKRLEDYAKAWLEVSPIGPEEMGRTAAKVESLEEVIHQLETQAAKITDCDSYFKQRMREDREGDPQRKQSMATGATVPGGMTTFKELDSSRLTFVGRPSFDPTPFLDPVSKRIFQDPLSARSPITPETRKPPRLRVHCSKSEKIRLFELLDSTDRLAFHRGDEVTPYYGSGLFAVTQSLEKDRLILDSRGANLLESPPGRWIKSLASSEVVSRMQLEDDEVLTFSGNDLRDFYYFFAVTASRSRRNVLVGPVKPQEVSHLKALKPCHHSEDEVFGALRTLHGRLPGCGISPILSFGVSSH